LSSIELCSSDVALLYNDRSVLENYHVSASFRLMKEEEFNILAGLRTDEYRYLHSVQNFITRTRIRIGLRVRE